MAGGGGIPQNFDFGSLIGGGSSGGLGGGPGFAAGWGGNVKQTGTTQAVSDDKGVLQAYDPNKMSMTTAKVAPTPDRYGQAAGYTASGLPSYITNWMASGSQGTMPTQSEMSTTPISGAHAEGIGAGTGLIDSPRGYTGKLDPVVKKPVPVKTPVAAATAAPAAVPGAAAPAQPGQPPFTPQQMQAMQALINEPWFKQRQWEMYGSPNANIGINQAGTNPVGWGAEQWFTPGRPPPGWGYGA